ncbi:DUF4153 domain-containing protein [Bacillus alkalicellulosilyticus]|uniref:DUF4153 domain-containing protein n=1 Tax=Alkalihalobacterium alkalicellulosilyticum TaxID=1912214 RepID=UPI0009983527|nr:DUF4173 domain-containing protein [Bacillus alkalicellulosilyticus]
MKREWRFMLLCLVVGFIVENSVFTEQIGVSYSIAVAGFYSLYFYHLKKVPFTHRQIGGYLFVMIWLLTISFGIYSNVIFHMFNVLLIPILIFIHTILLTTSSKIRWYSSPFLSLLKMKLKQTAEVFKIYTLITKRKAKRNVKEGTYQAGKKIGVGIIIAAPLLYIIVVLLSSADDQFARILVQIPELFIELQTATFLSIFRILVITLFIFFFLKALVRKTAVTQTIKTESKISWDIIIVSTVLIFINLVYLLFISVQFQYFFSGELQEGLSYAQYARKGFAELVIVTIINYMILLATLAFTKGEHIIIKGLGTLLISCSGVLLASAFVRLMLYEQAYGFTYLRIFAHAFMIYLFVILIFTLIKLWTPRLSLARFYLIFSLLFYVGMNMMDIDSFIVSKNIDRYEVSGSIDVYYLEHLSYSAVPGLVELYKTDPEIEGLHDMLVRKKVHVESRHWKWQSYNLSREQAKRALEDFNN